MPWNAIVYALICVIVPVAWGLVVYFISNKVEHAALKHTPKGQNGTTLRDESDPIPLDYNI